MRGKGLFQVFIFNYNLCKVIWCSGGVATVSWVVVRRSLK